MKAVGCEVVISPTSFSPLQYCPIPKLIYPQLEDELFCNQYYLRHLCDEARFPEWPITNHVEVGVRRV